jgi:hypothetical protein
MSLVGSAWAPKHHQCSTKLSRRIESPLPLCAVGPYKPRGSNGYPPVRLTDFSGSLAVIPMAD